MRSSTLTMAAWIALAGITAWSVPEATAETAEENYGKYCAKCHGDDGSGNGPAADVLDVFPGDFTDCERMASILDEDLATITATGGEAVGRSRQMPAAARIPPEDLPALVEYVRSFCK
ncbi:MAG: c-type cytochrome [Candidatus Binatia bacterium]